MKTSNENPITIERTQLVELLRLCNQLQAELADTWATDDPHGISPDPEFHAPARHVNEAWRLISGIYAVLPADIVADVEERLAYEARKDLR